MESQKKENRAKKSSYLMWKERGNGEKAKNADTDTIPNIRYPRSDKELGNEKKQQLTTWFVSRYVLRRLW